MLIVFWYYMNGPTFNYTLKSSRKRFFLVDKYEVAFEMTSYCSTLELALHYYYRNGLVE